MKPKSTSFFVIFLSSFAVPFMSTGCHKEHQADYHRYVFLEQTGDNEFILDNGRLVGFGFDERSSDSALISLRALKAEILYNTKDKNIIRIYGKWRRKDRLFTLDNWTLESPFISTETIDESQVPHEVVEVSRLTLERTDFKKTEGFDPDDAVFDPKEFLVLQK